MATKWKKKEEILEDNRRAYDTAINKAQTAANNTNLASQQKTGVNLADRMQRQPAAQNGAQNGAQNTPVAADVLNQWMNRQPFQYDVNNDALYQQYKDRYMRAGQMAMKDTIGQASALTGGYGNSYATAAGNLAYNEYLAKLNDKVPELYQMAYEQYQDEGDRLKDAYAMLYGAERDQIADEQWEKGYQLQVRAADLNERVANHEMSMEEAKLALQKELQSHNISMDERQLEETIRQANMDDAYRYAALGQDDAQFYATLGRQSANDANDYRLALIKAGYDIDANGNVVPLDTTNPEGTPDPVGPALGSIDYPNLGYSNYADMVAKVPQEIAETATSSGDYYDKLDEKLDNWVKKKYITEADADELRKRLAPTSAMLSKWNYGEDYKKYTTPSGGHARRIDARW